MMIKNLLFLALALLIASCSGDNDDEIFPNDVTNIDFETGIAFGLINPSNTGENEIFKFTSEGVFVALNPAAIDSTALDLNYSVCPFAESSLTYDIAKDVEFIARGVRDIPSSSFTETSATGVPFYVLEYEAGDTRKIIHFEEDSAFGEEQVNTYLDYIEETLLIISTASDAPQSFNDLTGLCE